MPEAARLYRQNIALKAQLDVLELRLKREERAAGKKSKRSLLERYLQTRHEGPMTAEAAPTKEFMFNTPTDTVGISYRADGRLIGYGIIDETPGIVSSLYFFFDPAESRRSLGTFSMMFEIEHARETGRRWYHPGFHVSGCAAMAYKHRFRPCQILDADGVWQDYEPK